MGKPPSHPPSKTKAGAKASAKPLTAKRKKILELAMAQLKKTRAQMDPKVLGKIRHIIASNPKVMKSLGLDKMPEEAQRNTTPQALGEDAPRSALARLSEDKKRSALARLRENKQDEVKIDQGHNQEVIAKLMQLKPSEVENIKKILLKKSD